MSTRDTSFVEIYLDNDPEPVARYRPPGRFELDTDRLQDGPHLLRIVAGDRSGHRGGREIAFRVRNGPGIAVDGLREGDVVQGKVAILVNAYGGAHEEEWEPERAETRVPVPTWAWVVSLAAAAWAMFYAVGEWRPPSEFAATPTYAAWAAPRPSTAERAAAGDLGAGLYRTTCANCHQANGEGVPGGYPPLVGDPVVTAPNPEQHIEVTLFGLAGRVINGVRYSAQMPTWAGQLSDTEIAVVINHERTNWGNSAPMITPGDVARVRAAYRASGAPAR
jgi:mono/diheme cytochrome c family protein